MRRAGAATTSSSAQINRVDYSSSSLAFPFFHVELFHRPPGPPHCLSTPARLPPTDPQTHRSVNAHIIASLPLPTATTPSHSQERQSTQAPRLPVSAPTHIQPPRPHAPPRPPQQKAPPHSLRGARREGTRAARYDVARAPDFWRRRDACGADAARSRTHAWHDRRLGMMSEVGETGITSGRDGRGGGGTCRCRRRLAWAERDGAGLIVGVSHARRLAASSGIGAESHRAFGRQKKSPRLGQFARKQWRWAASLRGAIVRRRRSIRRRRRGGGGVLLRGHFFSLVVVCRKPFLLPLSSSPFFLRTPTRLASPSAPSYNINITLPSRTSPPPPPNPFPSGVRRPTSTAQACKSHCLEPRTTPSSRRPSVRWPVPNPHRGNDGVNAARKRAGRSVTQPESRLVAHGRHSGHQNRKKKKEGTGGREEWRGEAFARRAGTNPHSRLELRETQRRTGAKGRPSNPPRPGRHNPHAISTRCTRRPFLDTEKHRNARPDRNRSRNRDRNRKRKPKHHSPFPLHPISLPVAPSRPFPYPSIPPREQRRLRGDSFGERARPERDGKKKKRESPNISCGGGKRPQLAHAPKGERSKKE